LVCLLLPVAGLFTGYYKTHAAIGAFQAVAYVAIFFGLRALARSREAAAMPSEPVATHAPLEEANQRHDA